MGPSLKSSIEMFEVLADLVETLIGKLIEKIVDGMNKTSMNKSLLEDSLEDVKKFQKDLKRIKNKV